MDFGPDTLGNCNNFKVNDLLWASEGRRVVHHPSLTFINPYQGLTKTNPPHPKACISNTNTTKVAASIQQAVSMQFFNFLTNNKQTTFGRIDLLSAANKTLLLFQIVPTKVVVILENGGNDALCLDKVLLGIGGNQRYLSCYVPNKESFWIDQDPRLRLTCEGVR